MGTEEFANAANLASNMHLRVQKGVGDHMARQLAYFNMPSREDVASLGERLISIDDRLARVEALLARLAPPEKKTAAGRPPRTKKPAAKKTKSGS